MIDINIKLTLDEVMVDGEKITNKENVPLDEMENWLEIYYENEKYKGEKVDVTVDIE